MSCEATPPSLDTPASLPLPGQVSAHLVPQEDPIHVLLHRLPGHVHL